MALLNDVKEANPGNVPPAIPPPSYSTQMPQPQQSQSYMTPQPQPQQQYQEQQPRAQHTPSAADIGRDYQANLFAQCAQGNHARSTKYGPCGIITAILLFPIGIICLFLDTETKCSRCGERL